MRARKLLEDVVLAPEQLAVLYEAFDAAWEAVKSQYASNPQATEVGRLRLANAVLAAYRDGVTGPAALTDAAIQMMQRWG
jgi:hypothetical protein